jgi:hypothetical protein
VRIDKTLTIKEICGDALEITPQLNHIQDGEHIILIYPDLNSLREIYSHYCKSALENHELVLLLVYYETANRVRQTLKEIGIDVESYEKGRTLLIIEDIAKAYFGSAEDFLFFLEIIDKQQKRHGKNGISVIADMGVFYHFQENKDALVRFESLLPARFDIKLKRICNYHKRDFDRLEVQEKRYVIESHCRQIKVAHPMTEPST